MRDYIEKVESELVKGDKNPGDLKDSTGLAYPEIFSALKKLSDEDRVTYYFVYITPLPTLTYHLKKAPFWQICKHSN